VTFQIDAVYQRTVAELEERGPMWMIFTPLAVDANREEMERVLARLRDELPERRSNELTVAMAVMADTDKRRRKLKNVIVPWLSKEIVMQSWIYKDGEKDGLKKGLEKGRAEGRAELLLDLLAAKFGRVPAKVRARVLKASPEELTAWGTRVLTATTLAEALAPPAEQGRSPRAAR